MITYLLDASGYIMTGTIAWLAFMIVYELILLVKRRTWSILGRVSTCFLGLYLTILFSVTVSPMYGFHLNIDWHSVNLIPGMVVKEARSNSLNLIGNILMFVPIGFLVPFTSKNYHSIKRVCLLGLGTTMSIEVLQLFLGRGTDVDDVILNMIGLLIGYIIHVVIIRSLNIVRITRRCNVRNWIATPILIVLMLATVLMTGAYKREQYVNGAKEFVSDQGAKTPKATSIQTTSPTEAPESPMATNEDAAAQTIAKSMTVTANNMYVVNASTNRAFYEKNEKEHIAPASTTKMITALTVIKYCEPGEVVVVGDELSLVAADASRAGLKQGNILTVRQLLEGMLLPSGNDAAYVLAAYTAKKVEQSDYLYASQAVQKFAEYMNQTARECGALTSNFVTPDGYDVEGQYTTAYDLACIAKHFMESEYHYGLLKEIVGQQRISEIFLDGSEVTWENTNELLDEASDYYEDCVIGLKTGSSEAAGKCLVSAFYIKDELYISVVMGDTVEGRYKDSIAMIDLLNN